MKSGIRSLPVVRDCTQGAFWVPGAKTVVRPGLLLRCVGAMGFVSWAALFWSWGGLAGQGVKPDPKRHLADQQTLHAIPIRSSLKKQPLWLAAPGDRLYLVVAGPSHVHWTWSGTRRELLNRGRVPLTIGSIVRSAEPVRCSGSFEETTMSVTTIPGPERISSRRTRMAAPPPRSGERPCKPTQLVDVPPERHIT